MLVWAARPWPWAGAASILLPVEGTPGRGESLSRVLDAAEDASPVQAVEAVTHELAAALGATAVSFLISDFSGRGLVRLVRRQGGDASDEEESQDIPFVGGPAERAMRTQTVQVLPPGPPRGSGPSALRWTVLAPVTERGEALGLLEMSLPAAPSSSVLAEIARIAHVLAFVVIANRRHTDLFERGQRSTRFALPAEIQRRLLPASFTCESGAFTLSAWLEPADNIAGDTFDYSVGRDVLHLSMTDAMGHGVASALSATLCLGSLRNARRQGASLLEQVALANTALVEYGREVTDDGFVTGLVGRLDLVTGTLALVNAGHVAPYLARSGIVAPVELPVDLPLGLFEDTAYRSTDLILEPGDRLVLVTDGMLERNAASRDITVEINNTMSLHPREATRWLADNVIADSGPFVADDATLLVLDWHGHHGGPGPGPGPGRDRDTVAGADSERVRNATTS